MDDVKEARSEAVQKVVNEAFELYALLARREWLLWGAEVLFPDLADEVE